MRWKRIFFYVLVANEYELWVENAYFFYVLVANEYELWDNMIETCSMQEFQELANSGVINEQTLVFNNLVNTKKEFESNWLIPLGKSWHKRMLSLK